EALHGFKFKTAYGAAGSDSIIGSSVTLALDWEYSLAQVNIDDFVERVLKGLEFHRLRGTPAALRNALSWYGFDNIIIEEEPPGEHFAEFQIGIEEIPNGFVPDPIINVAAYAAPLRSRLSRMYNKLYDERCLFLDNSRLDEGVLSDDSGIRLTEDGPKLSFGRVNNRAIEMSLTVVSAAALRNHFAAAKNFDTWRLDFATFDDLPSDAINRKATAERERTVFNTNPLGKIPADLFEPRRFSKSSIVLSEDATFDDLNTAFSGGYDEIEETPFILSFSPLSGSKTTIRRILIDEYFLREKVFSAINEFEPNILNGIREREAVNCT
ncbi:MAG: phage tail protein, partial [Holosporaceae bacterium]|nr:phage tail protein [Holosporaceae bacterium]